MSTAQRWARSRARLWMEATKTGNLREQGPPLCDSELLARPVAQGSCCARSAPGLEGRRVEELVGRKMWGVQEEHPALVCASWPYPGQMRQCRTHPGAQSPVGYVSHSCPVSPLKPYYAPHALVATYSHWCGNCWAYPMELWC